MLKYSKPQVKFNRVWFSPFRQNQRTDDGIDNGVKAFREPTKHREAESMG